MGSTSDVTISSLKTSHPPLLLALVAMMTATEPTRPPAHRAGPSDRRHRSRDRAGQPRWATQGRPSADRRPGGSKSPEAKPPRFLSRSRSGSVGSASPQYSRGTRHDLVQRERPKAAPGYWSRAGSHDPVSAVHGDRVIEMISFWTRDAILSLPPVRAGLWSDGDLYPPSHWLNRKVSLAAYDVSALNKVVTGNLRDRPMRPQVDMDALALNAPKRRGDPFRATRKSDIRIVSAIDHVPATTFIGCALMEAGVAC